jgi:hypothetical protein
MEIVRLPDGNSYGIAIWKSAIGP